MNNRNLIIHIGTHKTASSALQGLLARNRPLLEEQNILYPSSPDSLKHTKTFKSILQGKEEFSKELKRLQVEWDDSGCDTLLLSHERFSAPVIRSLNLEDFFSSILGKIKISTLVFLRRQDRFLESFWNQHAKTGICKSSISALLETKNMQTRIDYLSMLKTWQKIGPVRAYSFEKASQIGLTGFFAKEMGIELPQPKRRANVSPSMTCAAYMVRLNQAGITTDWKLLEAALKRSRIQKYALGSELRQDLLKRVASQNEQLRDEFGVVFPEDFPIEPVESISIPSLDKARGLIEQADAVQPKTQSS